jgi:hypothetical protein
MPRVQIHPERYQLDFAANRIRRNWRVSILIESQETAWLNRLVVEKIELQSYALGNRESGIRWLIGVRTVP